MQHSAVSIISWWRIFFQYPSARTEGDRSRDRGAEVMSVSWNWLFLPLSTCNNFSRVLLVTLLTAMEVFYLWESALATIRLRYYYLFMFYSDLWNKCNKADKFSDKQAVAYELRSHKMVDKERLIEMIRSYIYWWNRATNIYCVK